MAGAAAAAGGEGRERLQQMASGFSELTLNKLGNQKQKCIHTRKNIFECSNHIKWQWRSCYKNMRSKVESVGKKCLSKNKHRITGQMP